jgi:hypothetical protein
MTTDELTTTNNTDMQDVLIEVQRARIEIEKFRQFYESDRAAVLERITRITAGAKMALAMLRRML